MLPDMVKKWLERVEYDMKTAEATLQTGRYIYAVFMCQQAIEKCFKALIASLGRDVLPIHNLRRLAELSGLKDQFNKDQLMKLDFLSQYYINARYKEDITELSRGITEEFSGDMIRFSKEMIQWLTQRIDK
jgi:HEPN domain-containing protein